MTGLNPLDLHARSERLVAVEDWQPSGIDELEPAARDALLDEGCTAVVAGPGAGKTELLAQRAAFLLQTGRCPAPRRILAISYKRDSAANLGRRVATRVPEFAGRLFSVTFDSFTKGLVDRFRSALPPAWAIHGPYEVTFWTERQQRDFLTYHATRVSDPVRSALYGFQASTFLTGVVAGWALPVDPTPPTTAAEFAAMAWWREHYLRPGTQQIDFVMFNRLAELLVRVNVQLRRALRITYPFVFVDEFQDTTAAQLSILRSIFGGSAIVTAVGDRKQRIMGFAGALPKAIDDYAVAFGAKKYELTWNFRSSEGLVQLQHVIASRLDPTVVRAVSKAAVEDGHVPASLWTYASSEQEALHLAEWIAQDVAASSRTPADFALVARQKVAEYESRLKTALAKHGIKVRNDDAQFGRMRLQDMLKHDVARLVLGVLRLAAEPNGLGDVWIEVISTLLRIHGVADDDVDARAQGDEVARFTGLLRIWLERTPVADISAAEVVAQAVAVVGTDRLKGYVRSSHRGDDLEVVLESLTKRLEFVMPNSSNWCQAFEDVEAEDAVSLLTIHRSTGLEYHTVFFLGLDDQQWWAHARDVGESIAAFFVGLSRAAQRLIFTCTLQGARSGNIAELYALLDAAGVPETEWP